MGTVEHYFLDYGSPWSAHSSPLPVGCDVLDRGQQSLCIFFVLQCGLDLCNLLCESFTSVEQRLRFLLDACALIKQSSELGAFLLRIRHKVTQCSDLPQECGRVDEVLVELYRG